MTVDVFSEGKKSNLLQLFSGSDLSLTTNLVLSGITTIALFVSGTVLIMVLGRFLPVAVFGEVVYAFTFANLAMIIPSYGFPLMVVREIAQKRLSPAKAVINILVAQILLSLVTIIGLGIFVAFSHLPPGFYLVLSIFGVAGILNGFSTVISAINKGLNDFMVEAKVAVIKTLSICIFIFGALVLFPHTSITFGWAMLISNVLGLVAALILVRPLLMMERGLRPNHIIVRNLLGSGFPFALQLFLGTLYFQFDTLIVGQLINMKQWPFIKRRLGLLWQ